MSTLAKQNGIAIASIAKLNGIAKASIASLDGILMPASFPTVGAVNNGTDVASGTSATVQLPASIASGDLLFIFMGSDSNTSTLAAAGWTNLYNAGVNSHGHALYKIATGAEGATVAVTWSGNSAAVFYSMKVTTWHGTTPPEKGTLATGNSVSPDCPSLTPSWGSANTLWIAHAGTKGSTQDFTVWPTSYTYTQYEIGSNGGLAVATRQVAASSQDPSAYTMTPTNNWDAETIAVRPA